MIEIADQEYYDKVIAQVKERNLMEKLQEKLDYLASYANGPGCLYDKLEGKDTKCVLCPDFAPMSFSFVMYFKLPMGDWEPWFQGGLIFHEKGSLGVHAPTFATRVGDTDKSEWLVHT
jgi:hypothetical protein